MKFKRDIIIISLIMLMLFTVSSVCAGDSEIQAISNHNSTDTLSTVNDDDLKMDDVNEILAEEDDFNALNDAINGDLSKTYIGLEKDYHGSYDGGNGIQINRDNVVIDGKGHTIDCTGENSRMFDVQKDGIILKNIIFAGGSSDCGGAICTSKDLTIINCTFTNNQATSGGAIYADNVKMSIYGSTFICNHASSMGGAVAAIGDAPDDWEIFNCTFVDNSADDNGGAFYSHADQSMGDIVNSTFIGNRASAGDAIYNFGCQGTVERCIFVNNTANSMIYGEYAEMSISNSIIVNNYGDNLMNIQTPTLDNNWWGTTSDDEDDPVVSGETLSNYYVLDMAMDDDSADITLNNLYDNGVMTTSYGGYGLPSINLTVKAKNVEVAASVTLGPDGALTIEHAPCSAYEITIGYNGVELTREVKPTLKALSDKINAEGSEISLEQDYIYDSSKDAILTNGIEFAKDMTIDGQGHLIDAQNSSNIIRFDDDTNSYSLTLKNIIFANATGINGAAVYFKGNKIEIINCTFINNKADIEGDAVYVANALSDANRIAESVFSENAGSNSVLYLNLDSNANLTLTDSIFISNSAAYNVNGTPNVVLKHNWMGSTAENNNDLSKNKNVNVINWLFLKIDAVAALNGNAVISLNNVYDGSKVTTYSEYALRPVTLALGATNATPSVSEITLADNGQASYQFRMDRAVAALTAGHDNISTAKKLEYYVVDDGSFRALNEIIFFSDEGAVIELTHDYAYFDNDTITEGIVIPRKITVNGNGHTIDAKGKTRIFNVPEGVSQVAVNNVSFTNAKASHGSVIVINKDSNYFTFSNCNFTDNAATDYGGVMDCVGDYCTIDNCNFINNRAVSKAGVIRYYHDNLADIKNSNFINNKVADGSGGGGVIYVDDGAVNIEKSVFISNVANDRQGSVLYAQKSATITGCLLLNNTGSSAIYGLGVELADNWFGNNAGDYAALVNATNAVLKTWLFLNATADSSSIPELWPADLSFRLYSYNATSKSVSEYDSDFFNGLELTITAANGRTDKSIVNLGETLTYTPASPGSGSVTAAVENVLCTAQFDVHERKDSHLSVNSPNVPYGSNAIVLLNYNVSATGKVNITLKGKNGSYSFIDVDLKASFAVDEILNSGAYNVTAVYSGDAVFSNATANSVLTVDRANSSLDINPVAPIDYGGDVKAYYSFKNATGISVNLSFKNGTAIGENIKKYDDCIVVPGLDADNYTLKFSTEVDANHYSISKTVDFTVNKVNSTVSIPEIVLDFGESKEVTVNAEGVESISAKIDNGNASVKGNIILISGLNAGTQTLSVTTNPDKNHYPVTKTANITVNKVNSTLTVGNMTFDYNSTGSLEAEFSGAERVVAAVVGHPEAVVKVNGKLITVSGLNVGNYVLNVTTDADGNHNNVSGFGNITVNKINSTLTVDDVVMDYGTSVNVNVTVDGAKYITAKIANGNAEVKGNVITVSGLSAGTHLLTVTAVGDDDHNNLTKTVNVTVRKVDSTLTVDNVVMDYGTPFKLNVTVEGATLITAKLDGVDFTVSGNTIPIHGLSAGKHFLTVTAVGDDNHNNLTKTVNVTVNRVPSILNVAGCNLSYGDSAEIAVSTGGAINITAKIDDKVLNVSDYKIKIPTLDAGTHKLSVTTVPDDNHTAVNRTVDINVSKVSSLFSIRNLTLMYGGSTNVTVSPTGAGAITARIDDKNITVVNNSTIQISGLDAGNYTLSVTTVPDGNHYAVTKTARITVNKADSDVSVKNIELNYGTPSYMNLSTNGAKGITAKIDGNGLTVNGTMITIPVMDVGTHTLSVTTVPDDNHNAVTRTATIKVNKLKSAVASNDLSAITNQKVDLTAKVTVSNNLPVNEGKVTFFNGKTNMGNATVVNGVATLAYVPDVAGNHVILMIYGGSEIYEASNSTFTLSVTGQSDSTNASDVNSTGNVTAKVSPNLNASACDVNVGENVTVDISINENVTGKVILSGYGTEKVVSIYDGKGSVIISNLTAGSYSVLVRFEGDDHYLGENKTVSFRVIKADSPVNETNASSNVTNVTKVSPDLTVSVLDVNLGENVTINVSINNKVTGKVTISFNNQNHDVDIAEGKGIAYISGLAEGSYSVLVMFEGDNHYLGENKTVSFRVIKADSPANETNASGNVTNVTKVSPDLTVSVLDVNVGEKVTVDISINEKVTGNVILSVNGFEKIVEISKGKGCINILNLTEGSYSVLVRFEGDDHYLGENKTVSFRVIKADSPVNETNATGNVTNVTKVSPDLTVSVSDVNVGENVTVNISINNKVTGKVTISLGNVESVVGIYGGKGIVNIPGLAEGSYSVVVKFEGDDYYIAENKTASFNVVKAQSPVNGTDITKTSPDLTVSVLDVNVGENVTVNISINNKVTGKVTISLGNVESVVGIYGGKGIVNIPGLAEGSYSVVVRFEGDDYYLGENKTVSFNVVRAQSPVNGTNITDSNSTSGNVSNITKTSPDLTVGAENITVGEPAVVSISVNENATGKVTLTFNGVESAVDISNGRGSFTVLNLAEGNYSVLVRFAGDDHYLAFNVTAAFSVTSSDNPINGTGNNTEANATNITKTRPDLTVSVDNITVGEPASVSISVNENATGMVTLIFNGVESAVDISNGRGSFTVLNLAEGNYSVLVRFAGDDHYLASNVTAAFSVTASDNPVNGTGNITRSSPDLTVSAEDIVAGETAVIYIEINPNATGKVTVNGKEINIANGRTTVTVSNLAAGQYNITVSFEGDKYFNAEDKTVTINVGKAEKPDANPFNVDETKTVESSAPTYSISLPSDASGNLTVIIGDNVYTAEVVNGGASIKIVGLPAGEYNVTVSYSGDGKYPPIVKNTTSKVVVDAKVVMSQASVLYTGKYSVTVYGNDGKAAGGQYVTFYVNGKKVKTVKTNSKGVASFNMPSNYLPNKKITVKATALGKSASKKVTVKQVLSIKKVKVKRSARKLVLTATLKKVDGKYLKGKKITFTFNGKKIKTVKTNSKGVAKVSVKKSLLNKLKAGKKVTYKATYLKTTVKKTVKVRK